MALLPRPLNPAAAQAVQQQPVQIGVPQGSPFQPLPPNVPRGTSPEQFARLVGPEGAAFRQQVVQAQQDAGVIPGSSRIADLSPAQVAQIQAAMNRNVTGVEQFQTQAAGQPLIGLEGATAAIGQGSQASLSALEELLGQARGEIASGRERALAGATGLFERGVQPLEQIGAGAAEAQQQQAALSGALGPEAQAQAIAAFQASPQQQFLREEGERALVRNAAALGGLGGGQVRRELARFGTGLAAQDFGQQFARLGEVANRGLGARTAAAQLGAGQAGLQTGIEQAATEGTAGLLAGQGRDAASILGGAGSRLADLRFQTGRDVAQAISGTTQGLANLSNEQGQALQSIFGEGAANVANLFNLAGQGDAASQEQLAQLLSNLDINEATLLANLFAGQGSARLTGDIAGGGVIRDTVGRIFEALPIPTPGGAT